MTIKTLFWNVWLDNQIQGRSKLNKLLAELEKIVLHHDPDFIGLNELLQHKNEDTPKVLERL